MTERRRTGPAPVVRVRSVGAWGWMWTCPAELHGGRPGQVVGEAVAVGDYPCAWSAALALGVRHAALYHADARRLALALDLEAREVGEDDGPVDPPDPDAVHHLEACS